MKKTKGKAHEYHSMEEYKKRFYPESYNNLLPEDGDPDKLGTILAEEMLNKFKNLMQKQKVCI